MNTDFRINRLSRSANYALQGLAWLAGQEPGQFYLLSDVAAAGNLPESYLAKIFQKLSKRGLLKARPGVKGGYALARKPEEIHLSDIVCNVEDQLIEKQCLLELRACNADNPCILHDQVVAADGILIDALKTVTLKKLVDEKQF